MGPDEPVGGEGTPAESAPVDTIAAAQAVADRHAAGTTPQQPQPAPQETGDEPGTPEPADIDLGVDTTGMDPEAVQRVEAQFKAAMTRARQRDRQEVQEQLAEAREALELRSLLSADDESTKVQALNMILQANGYPTLELVDEEGGQGPDDPFEELDPDDPATHALRALQQQQQQQMQERERAAEEAAEQQQNEQLRSEGRQALAAYAEQRGLELDQVPDVVRNQLVAFALAAPVTEQGGLDWQQATETYDAARSWEIEQFLASKRATPPRLEGGAGVKQFDPNNDKERLAAAQAVAGRHF